MKDNLAEYCPSHKDNFEIGLSGGPLDCGYLGDRFLCGIVLYTGDQHVPFGVNFHALPVSALWELGARPQPEPD